MNSARLREQSSEMFNTDGETSTNEETVTDMQPIAEITLTTVC